MNEREARLSSSPLSQNLAAPGRVLRRGSRAKPIGATRADNRCSIQRSDNNNNNNNNSNGGAN